MTILLVFFLLGLVKCISSETCPSDEMISPCTCKNKVDTGDILVMCRNDTMSLEELKRVLNSMDGKTDVKILLQGLMLGNVSSNFFSGVGITTLYVVNCKIDSLTDGEPDFLGLEDCLKELLINSSISDEISPVRLNISHLRELESLSMFDNSINELNNDWLDDAPLSLKIIEVAGNGIKTLGDRVFANLINAEHIQIRGNDIDSIQRSMFPDPAEKLHNLFVEDNNLTAIPEDFFSNMYVLKSVSLWKNRISRLEKNTWKPILESLELILLEENPLVCDAHMEWLFTLQVTKELYGVCKYPEEKNGMDLLRYIKENSEHLQQK